MARPPTTTEGLALLAGTAWLALAASRGLLAPSPGFAGVQEPPSAALLPALSEPSERAREPSLAELRGVEGVGDTLARRLLDARWRSPPASHDATLEPGAVPGIGPRRSEALRATGLFAGGGGG